MVRGHPEEIYIYVCMYIFGGEAGTKQEFLLVASPGSIFPGEMVKIPRSLSARGYPPPSSYMCVCVCVCVCVPVSSIKKGGTLLLHHHHPRVRKGSTTVRRAAQAEETVYSHGNTVPGKLKSPWRKKKIYIYIYISFFRVL